MKAWSIAALTAAAVVLGNACNSNGTPNPTPSTALLEDEYEPVGAVPANGGIAQITFNADGSYFLKRMADPSADEILVPEYGSFALDLGAGTLTLTPHDGTAQALPFQLGLTGTSSATSGSGIHTQGLVGNIVHLILSFFYNGQQFHTDAPATPDNNVTDDAGWPADDGSAGQPDADTDAGGCSNVLGPPTGSGNGVDVSHYQRTVDWTTVKTARNFAYAKATEGVSYTDTAFATNYQGIQAAGLQRGAYHFFRASKDAVAQADYFLKVLIANGFNPATDLAPMLDVEVLDGVDAATVTAGVGAFLNEAQTKLGVTLMIYTGPSFWKSTLGNPNFSTNPLWIAHYTKAAQPSIPSTWSAYTIWQYTQGDTVGGITTPVDGDRWNGASAPVVSDAGADSSTGSCGFDAGDAGDAGLIPGTCTHDVCTAGVALGQACTSCTMVVCAADPYCCDTYWGLSCFPDVQKYCGMTCP
jgi:GH25 family lysozyme M1 (1,4-beta-N-acetylmuramidase)